MQATGTTRMILTRNSHPRNLHLDPSPPFPNHLFPVAFLSTLREGSLSDLNLYRLTHLQLFAITGVEVFIS